MMKRSKAKIVVIGTVVNGKTTRVVEITGTESQVAVAKQLVDCVITHGADALDQSGKASMALGIITKYVDVTTDDFKQLAGSLGPGLKTVSHISNATISVIGPNPKRNEDHNLRRISVKGTQNCVEIALNMIKEAMDKLNIDMNVIVDKDFKHVDDADSVGSPSKDKSPPESPMSASGAAKIVKKSQIATKTVQCPLTRVGTLIGTRGVIVKEIMKRSGATIVVAESSFLDDSDPPVEVREVHIKGSKNAVATAEKIVRSLIENGTKVLNKGYNEKDDVLKVSSN
jgi:rRNA processing protein Krr1/Pno1